MILQQKDLIQKELEEGTGAAISISPHQDGLRAGLKIWFGDLEEREGPVASLKPHGLKAYRVDLTFGRFSNPILTQIRNASEEDVQLARALVQSISPEANIDVVGQNRDNWSVTDGQFKMTSTIRYSGPQDQDKAILFTCREVMVPIMAAMAELIGYEVIVNPSPDDTPALEGAISRTIIKRRERNPRNRLLCIRIHGEKCSVCGTQPKDVYGQAGSIIEVHHLEPVSLLEKPRAYDPTSDLKPLCPSCHRAVHTRRPIPYSLEELKQIMCNNHG